MMAEAGGVIKNCIALTGAIATGKSAVARMFADLGAHIIDTDLIAREVVAPGNPALAEIAESFGRGALNPDGTLNRELVRERIIRDPGMRARLNRITHPRIQNIVMERITGCRRLGDGMPVIIDVPLLYEAGWDRVFPGAIVVYAPVAIQVERLMARDGLDRATAELTVAAQMGIEEKKGRARFVIDNSGTLEETRMQVEEIFDLLLGSERKH